MTSRRSKRVFLIAGAVSLACAVRLVLPNAHVHGDLDWWAATFVLLLALPTALIAGAVFLIAWLRERRASRDRRRS